MTADTTKTVRAVCPHDCPDTCGMVARVRDGCAIDLRGDPDHPFTRGFLCQKVARYLDRVYHADRLLWPMRGSGKGERGLERSPHSEYSEGGGAGGSRTRT